MLGPADMPKPIVAMLNTEIGRAITQLDMQERFVARSIDLAPSTPVAFAALIQSEIVKRRKVVRDAGVKVD